MERHYEYMSLKTLGMSSASMFKRQKRRAMTLVPNGQDRPNSQRGTTVRYGDTVAIITYLP